MEAAGSGRINKADSFLRRITRRSRSFQQLLVTEAVGGVTVFTDDGGRNDDHDVPLPGYERLSQSMRSPEDPDPIYRNKQKQKQKMQYVFARRGGEENDDDNAEAKAERRRQKEKKRSSWLPDPEKRWPIQGWG